MVLVRRNKHSSWLSSADKSRCLSKHTKVNCRAAKLEMDGNNTDQTSDGKITNSGVDKPQGKKAW